MKKKQATSLDTLFEALLNYVPPPVVEVEYRVYYDPVTRDCILKSINDEPGTFVLVAKDEYEAISFSPNYYVTSKNEVKLKRIASITDKMLQLSTTGHKALKNNNIFAVGEDYAGEVDIWNLREPEHE